MCLRLRLGGGMLWGFLSRLSPGLRLGRGRRGRRRGRLRTGEGGRGGPLRTGFLQSCAAGVQVEAEAGVGLGRNGIVRVGI